MGKIKAVKFDSHRRDPLHVSLRTQDPLQPSVQNRDARKKYAEREQRREQAEKSRKDIDEKMKKKVISLAKEYQEELEDQEESDAFPEDDDTDDNVQKQDSSSQYRAISGFESEEDDAGLDQDDEYEELEIDMDADDEQLLQRFLPAARPQRKTLADMIMEKIKAHESTSTSILTMQDQQHVDDTQLPIPASIPDKVVHVYKQVGLLLSRYKSGKLPKAFKIIPSLKNWSDILYITQPEQWTANATFAATKVFASNLQAKQAQKFYEWVLLPKVREDIAETKKLNVHLYQALKKALYKPAAFFKGFLFPLCEVYCLHFFLIHIYAHRVVHVH